MQETIDRGDPRFIMLLQSIYEIWEQESEQFRSDWNIDRIKNCLTKSHGHQLDDYLRELTEKFTMPAVLRVLNKHILLQQT